MLYLGIDQHARQLTISLRNDDGDVVQSRQVSTQPEKINAFFQHLIREYLSKGESFLAVVEVSDFPDYIDASGGQAFGAFATRLSPGSTAEKAVFKSGDTIIALDDTEIRTLKDLQRAVNRDKKSVTVKVFRNYQQHELQLSP